MEPEDYRDTPEIRLQEMRETTSVHIECRKRIHELEIEAKAHAFRTDQLHREVDRLKAENAKLRESEASNALTDRKVWDKFDDMEKENERLRVYHEDDEPSWRHKAEKLEAEMALSSKRNARLTIDLITARDALEQLSHYHVGSVGDIARKALEKLDENSSGTYAQ